MWQPFALFSTTIQHLRPDFMTFRKWNNLTFIKIQDFPVSVYTVWPRSERESNLGGSVVDLLTAGWLVAACACSLSRCSAAVSRSEKFAATFCAPRPFFPPNYTTRTKNRRSTIAVNGVTCHPTQVNPVLNLPTPEGRKVQLTLVVGYVSRWKTCRSR